MGRGEDAWRVSNGSEPYVKAACFVGLTAAAFVSS
jgi:hypothetical protein